MRSWLLTIVAVLWCGTASAQFGNKSLGLSVGYLDLNDRDALENAIPIGLEGSIYVENGFDVVAHFAIMIVRDRISSLYVVGISPSLGVRYLFLEESFRPYFGVDLSYLAVFRPSGYSHYVGLGPNLGFDYFVNDNIALGIRGVANVWLMLNRPVQLSIGGQFIVSTYF